MTTKPRAKKFRVKRSVPAQSGGSAAAPGSMAEAVVQARQNSSSSQKTQRRPSQDADQSEAPHTQDQSSEEAQSDAAASRDFSSDATDARQAQTSNPGDRSGDDATQTATHDGAKSGETSSEAAINAVRREGLTGRQLRMARRVAQKHNLPATSDFDAVRLLRQHGIDPFKRANILELVAPQSGANNAKDEAPTPGRIQLPQTVSDDGPNLPATDFSPSERRSREVGQIQRDIAKRRRKRLILLLSRLAFFVLLPTIIVGFYYYKIATPMYSAKSEFLILQADSAGGGGGLGGLLTGTQFATSQDSIAVQSYLQSKDAMLRLDRDVGFKSHFTQDWIDPIQRLNDSPTNEEAYKAYRKNVKISYDPTEGVVKMDVIAADPQVSTDFSTSLISYAEERVNGLSQQKRGDQMKDALEGFENAQAERRNAQEALVQLQQKGAILDPEGVIAGLRGQINNVETQLQEKQLQLAALLDNARPNQAKVDGARGDVRRLEDLLETLNKRMTDASLGENSLAQLSVRIQMAQADLATRDMMLQSALQMVEQTRMEANRQVRYLTISVKPVPSEEATYPRKFENTILAFLIFSGIYLMISLTASILREQVTA